MPLTMLNLGEAGLIKRISGQEETKRFLANLGFTVGSGVTVVSKISGNLIVSVKDSRVALSSELATKIFV